MDRFDICIIGAGVIGIAVARALTLDKRFSKASIVLLEQEAHFGQHTSSRNSEVIHAGIYYPEDSLKASLCVRGKHLLYEYCQLHNIPHHRCGKLIVAAHSDEGRLHELAARALSNGVDDLVPLTASQLADVEPAVKADVALFSPSSGIVDSHSLMEAMLHESQKHDVIFAAHTRVTGIDSTANGYSLHTQIDGAAQEYQFDSAAIINCAGLFADQILALCASDSAGARVSNPALASQNKIHYCKGDYFSYSGPLNLNHLVYPMPEANTVGLGIHATLDLGGQIRFGPDTEYIDDLDYRIEDSKKEHYAQAIQRYLPAVTADSLSANYAGIRPKLSAEGEAAADFKIATANGEQQDSQIHLLGIESPGLTASLAIAEMVSAKLILA